MLLTGWTGDKLWCVPARESHSAVKEQRRPLYSTANPVRDVRQRESGQESAFAPRFQLHGAVEEAKVKRKEPGQWLLTNRAEDNDNEFGDSPLFPGQAHGTVTAGSGVLLVAQSRGGKCWGTVESFRAAEVKPLEDWNSDQHGGIVHTEAVWESGTLHPGRHEAHRHVVAKQLM